MDRDEQRRITELIDNAVGATPGQRGAVLDVEADAIIRALFVRNPEAAYRVTMLAVAQMQEIKRLQEDLSDMMRRNRANVFARLFRAWHLT